MADPLDDVFAALADPTRRDLVARLATSDATVGELAEPYDISLQAVSKHVRVLERAGLVTKAKDAQRRTVHLEAGVFDLMTKWIERYRREAEARYARLDAVLAELSDEEAADASGPATSVRTTSSARTTSARTTATDRTTTDTAHTRTENAS